MLKLLMVILIVTILAAGGVLYKDYSAQSAAADNLWTQMELDVKVLNKTSDSTLAANLEIASLDRTISDTDKAIATETAVIPDKMNPNEIVRNVLMLAEQSQVQVIPLGTKEWTKVKVGQHDYSVFRMSVKVTGNQILFMDFVKKLSSLYGTLVIEDISISRLTEVEVANMVEGELGLAIYAKK